MSTDDTPLWKQHMTKCVHFNGLMNDACEAGVTYGTVRDESVRPYGYPCWTDRACSTSCDKARFPTEGEAKAWERDVRDRSARFWRELSEGICGHSHQPMTKRQVGRCVYADPCGHRLYQGSGVMSLRDELGEREWSRCVRVWRDYCASNRGLTGRHVAMCVRLNGEGK